MEAARDPQQTLEAKPLAVARSSRQTEFEQVVADPDPLGLFGFAFATFLANLSAVGVYSFNAMWLSVMVSLGGAAELVAGLQDYRRNNLFGATVFSFLGVGWMGNAVTTWLVHLGVVPETDPISNGWHHIVWAVFVAAMAGASLKLNKTLTAILVLGTLLELLTAVGSLTGITSVARTGAVCGMISAVLGLYLATAGLWNTAFGRTVLRVGERKR